MFARSLPTHKQRGLSLLEILFTIGLITVILVAFAAVYPSAYRLNRKSAKATVAAKTASAVAAEILSLPFTDVLSNGADNLTLMATASVGPARVREFVENRMRTKLPAGFRVYPEAVRVNMFPEPATMAVTDTRFAQVSVTCYWTDAQAAGLERHLTIVSGKAENRDVR